MYVARGWLGCAAAQNNMTYLQAVAQIVHTMRRQLLLASPVRLTRAPIRRQHATNMGAYKRVHRSARAFAAQAPLIVEPTASEPAKHRSQGELKLDDAAPMLLTTPQPRGRGTPGGSNRYAPASRQGFRRSLRRGWSATRSAERKAADRIRGSKNSSPGRGR